MDDRLVLLYDKKILGKGLRNYDIDIENLLKLRNKETNELIYLDKNKFKTIKLKDFGWSIIIKRGGKYFTFNRKKNKEGEFTETLEEFRNNILVDDLICVNKKDRIIVYRGGVELQIDSKDLNSKTDHVLRPLNKNEIEDNNGKYKIKE